MLNLMNMILFIFFVAFLISILASFLSKKSIYDREKTSPIECGFDPINKSRLPFSLQFFLIAIIFLIFDVEIALIIPIILIFQFCHLFYWFLTSFMFVMILIIGLYHEWNQGALKWSL